MYDSIYYDTLKNINGFQALSNTDGKKLLKKLYIDLLCTSELNDIQNTNFTQNKLITLKKTKNKKILLSDNREAIKFVDQANKDKEYCFIKQNKSNKYDFYSIKKKFLKKNELIFCIKEGNKISCLGLKKEKKEFKKKFPDFTFDAKDGFTMMKKEIKEERLKEIMDVEKEPIFRINDRADKKINKIYHYFDNNSTINKSTIKLDYTYSFLIKLFTAEKENLFNNESIKSKVVITKECEISNSNNTLQEKDYIIMIDDKKINNDYAKILRDLRNAVAHANICLDTNGYIIFKSINIKQKNKITLMAKIHKDNIDCFIKELLFKLNIYPNKNIESSTHCNNLDNK